MSRCLTLAAPLSLFLLSGAALAQDDPPLIGISVDGTVVEVPVDLAAQACGISAETLLEQWKQLDTQMATMADTSVTADATDLAPVASPEDTQRASGVRGEAGQGADEDPAGDTAGTGADAASDSAGDGDLAPVAEAAAPDASAAENPQNALGDAASATEGTALSMAAVCEIGAQKATDLGIETPS